LWATLGLLAEAQRSSGSAVAGAHIQIGDADDTGPATSVARVAASLAKLAEADRLLVTREVVDALGGPADLAFDDGPHADADGHRIMTYVVRRP
jgi:class 3 adenylate cyclase